MDIGFETIGNATLVAHDGRPVVVTDPWIRGGAYFGSWKLSHDVPEAQFRAACEAEYVWFSHGHPDHMNGDSLPLFKNAKVLLPDHVGGRIHRDLTQLGYRVMVLPVSTWVPLSPRIRVMCVPDFNQDAILLLDINGRLVMNFNDAGDRGWGHVVRRVAPAFRLSYLLALYGHGDADMINYFDESGQRRPRPPKTPLGEQMSRDAEYYGARYVIPFSSMHRYQRTDSAWASYLAAGPDDYRQGWYAKRSELLPAFVRVNCIDDSVERINPPETANELHPPEHFGDNWSDQLEADDVRKIAAYFLGIEKLRDAIDFLTFRIGGKEHTVSIPSRRRFSKGLTFEAPRSSLMQAIDYEVFDDLLIGNFTKVTLHGEWPKERPLYPDFTPYVAKYADNGRARTRAELAAYFKAYRARDPMGHLRHVLRNHVLFSAETASRNVLAGVVGSDSNLYRVAKKAYGAVRSRT